MKNRPKIQEMLKGWLKAINLWLRALPNAINENKTFVLSMLVFLTVLVIGSNFLQFVLLDIAISEESTSTFSATAMAVSGAFLVAITIAAGQIVSQRGGSNFLVAMLVFMGIALLLVGLLGSSLNLLTGTPILGRGLNQLPSNDPLDLDDIQAEILFIFTGWLAASSVLILAIIYSIKPIQREADRFSSTDP